MNYFRELDRNLATRFSVRMSVHIIVKYIHMSLILE